MSIHDAVQPVLSDPEKFSCAVVVRIVDAVVNETMNDSLVFSDHCLVTFTTAFTYKTSSQPH